jgi:RNA-directed DNA polymerase
MGETPSSPTISTKSSRIAAVARAMPGVPLTALGHHIDLGWMREAYKRVRKDGATGVDRQNAQQYEKHLEDNLQSLLERAKSGHYRAPPVRRVHIPKGDGLQTRPIGIPTFEDKILQRAVAMVIEPIYEEAFHAFSYGFRPCRSAHDACEEVQHQIMKMAGGWLLDVDIEKFFDTLDHGHLMDIVERRVRDGVVLRLIGKWLNAGVMEGFKLSYPDAGTPQGGVISPLLANVYLHTVLDDWFVREVRPRLKGPAALVRYADDFVVICGWKVDAQRVFAVLPKRFGRYGLTLHAGKTRLVPFQRPDRGRPERDRLGTFDFLGFTHYWGKSRKGHWIVMRRTAKDRFRRTLRRISEWCRAHRHWALKEQHRALSQKLRGHYAYYGITFNMVRIAQVWHRTQEVWCKWLRRRSQKAFLSWDRMRKVLTRYPLPAPRIVHQFGT